MTLRKVDLEAAIVDDRRRGTVGYSERDFIRSATLRRRGDSIVVREANRQHWTYLDLLIWVDSKMGRWFWDALYGCKDQLGATRLVTLDWLDDDERAAYEH